MARLTIFFLLISIISSGQIQFNYSEIIPKNITVKHLFDTSNYIDNSLRLSIVDYLTIKQLDPTKYFVDSTINIQGDTMYIALWNFAGLKRLKEIEKQNKKNETQMTLTGNPGYCGTIQYDKKTKQIIGFYLWQ